ncbi:hypothetical protein LH935_16360 [Gordonia polyisoprenivorans]|uniref:hypothetical protein n=1 Tax=Gordonia polyisoprenivorans TaxID=84595 RepID=UPI0022342193|nr:hypothetical protein LH935_16360 [Gordonia polyisoprenivorans]
MIPKKSPSKADSPAKSPTPTEQTRCPACGSRVAPADIDAQMLAADADPTEIDALRAQRQARKAGAVGDIRARVDALDLADKVRANAAPRPGDGPTKGTDTCPACGSEHVVVDSSKLSVVGRRILARSASQATAKSVDQIRSAKSAPSKAKMAEDNRRAAVAREGARKSAARRWGRA